MNREEKIMKRLEEHYAHLQEKGYEVVGLFLVGSQNYDLDYEGSDIDTKAIVVPTLEDIVLGKSPISTTLILENEEHIDVKDIRVMLNTIKKQNINFVEILFTEFHIINEKYLHLIEPLFENAERIARMNNYAAINCMCGMAMEKLKALEHPYPSTMDKIEKFGYDPKQLHHILRMNEFMLRYINGESYAKCLKTNQPDFLLKVKLGGIDHQQAKHTAETVVGVMGDIKKVYGKTNEKFFDEEMNSLLDDTSVKVITQFLKEGLKGGDVC